MLVFIVDNVLEIGAVLENPKDDPNGHVVKLESTGEGTRDSESFRPDKLIICESHVFTQVSPVDVKEFCFYIFDQVFVALGHYFSFVEVDVDVRVVNGYIRLIF